jgi:hypothetical protein
VSDSFLGALWTLDFLLLLAANGCAGVNLETGVNQLGFISSYSPIQDDGQGVNTAGIPYYGMLAFTLARQGCGEMIPIVFDSPVAGLTAYAMGTSGAARSVVIINRDFKRDVQVSFDQLGIGKAHVVRLTAPSMESRSNVLLGGATVGGDGRWVARESEQLHHGPLRVPSGSAAIVCTAPTQ